MNDKEIALKEKIDNEFFTLSTVQLYEVLKCLQWADLAIDNKPLNTQIQGQTNKLEKLLVSDNLTEKDVNQAEQTNLLNFPVRLG